MNLGAIANAAKGILDNTAEYGELLGDQTPESLFGPEYADWDWVDDKTKTYFGKPGNQKFVIRNAATDEAATAYKEVTVPVQKRSVAPVVKQGTISGTAASFVTATVKANIGTYERTVTVTAGTGGTIAVNNSDPSASISGTYVIGESVQLTATADDGYKFTGWSDGDDTNPRTITVNGDVTYTATFEQTNIITVTDSLPAKIGDVSIMTIEQVFTALGTTNGSDPSFGYSSSTYAVYGIAGVNGVNSTPANLLAVGLDWYKQKDKPKTVYHSTSVNGQSVFGGMLSYVYYFGSDYDKYYFEWFYSEDDSTNSRTQSTFWDIEVPGSVYVAVVRINNIAALTSSLPKKSGDVSIMTLEQAYIALGGSTSSTGAQYDSTKGYNSSTYYMYGCGSYGSESRSGRLLKAGLDWYKLLNKPTTIDQTFSSNEQTIWGGPLNYVSRDSDGKYYFSWYYSDGKYDTIHSGYKTYWYKNVPSSYFVAVVRS